MTTASALRPTKPSTQVGGKTPPFTVGQAVRVRPSFRYGSVAGVYYITATLPPSEGQLQYRIRNDDERYERVAAQDTLELVTASSSGAGATLIEKTFGRS